jgi:hypothetical protein
MQIDSLAYAQGPSIYYDDAFRSVLEDHISFLKTHPKTNVVSVQPHDAYKYEGDLYGLFANMNIPAHYHWIVMRTNGFRSPFDGSENMLQILVPSTDVIDKIRQSHSAKRKIT